MGCLEFLFRIFALPVLLAEFVLIHGSFKGLLGSLHEEVVAGFLEAVYFVFSYLLPFLYELLLMLDPL